MSSQGGGQRLRGRASECETLRDLISAVQSGSSRVLVLRGEAGVGKTALLEYVAVQARAFRCVHVAGVESDIELAFAGLQQLCAPLLVHVDELPEPQREALNVAFGRGVGPTPDRFLVGLAVLSLIAAAANDQPLLCLIDDAQWLDQVSVQTLAFVARRLLAEPVALVFAARDGGANVLPGLPELVISGLSNDDARKLLDSVVLGRLDDGCETALWRRRVAFLWLCSRCRATFPQKSCPVVSGIRAAPLGGPDRGRLCAPHQISPADTQRLLLVAAAEPVGDSALFLRAAAQLGIPVDALAPAEAAG